MSVTTTAENLRKRGFLVSVFDTKEDAAAYLDRAIDGCTVGIGGSVTLKEMGVYDRLSAHNTVYWHWENAALSRMDLFRRAAESDVYLSSVNAIAESGEIVNIDGSCNRVSAIAFGHKKVYLVAGMQKIAKDLATAIDRARNIAAPKNAQRLKRNTPCARNADRCYDCHSPERICAAVQVLLTPSSGQETEVVLIREEIGY